MKVEEGLSVADAAERSGAHRSTVYRLIDRFHAGGWAALKSVDCPGEGSAPKVRGILRPRRVHGHSPRSERRSDGNPSHVRAQRPSTAGANMGSMPRE